MTAEQKPYYQMDAAELTTEHELWVGHAREATGFPSAYFAAKQIEQICANAKRCGVELDNPFPIKRG